MADIRTFTVYTGMGKSNDWKKLGLTREQCEILNDIGYGSNKNYGRDEIGFRNFLNSIDINVKYEVSCVRSDNAEFSAQYSVVKVMFNERENVFSEITVEDYAENIIELLKKRCGEKIKVTISKVEKDDKQQAELETKRKEDEVKKREQLALQQEKRELETKLKEINRKLG